MPRVLHVAAEAYPLIKTGGLADVAGALPQAQRMLGADARLLLPAYPSVRAVLEALGAEPGPAIALGSVFGASSVQVREVPAGPGLAPVVLLESPWHFERPGNPYLDADGQPWSDNPMRFGLLGWVAAQIAAGGLLPHFRADVVHAHDWHAGLALAYLRWHPAAPARRVFTIHNLAFQGRFPMSLGARLGLPEEALGPDALEFYGELSFMKAGLVGAHRITTVSPRYAQEIRGPAFGEGLDGLLRHRAAALEGILNGIDTETWNPDTDTRLKATYRAGELGGKRVNRRELLAEFRLPADDGERLLIAIVSRLSWQKGMDLVLQSAPAWLAAGCRLVLLGSGERWLEDGFRTLARDNPDAVAVRIGFDEGLSHRIFGGADAVLVPSRYEPCGLTQLYGLRYGAVPIVRRVGGLSDTVTDAAEPTHGNGFVFDTPGGIAEALVRAAAVFRDAAAWRRLVDNGMRADHGWARAARQYLECYERAAESAA